MQTFAQQYLEKRDRGMTPQESWKRRADMWDAPVSKPTFIGEEITISLLTPIERLSQEDFEFVLLAGAASDAFYMRVYVRSSLGLDESLELLVRLQALFISPYQDIGCFCAFCLSASDIKGCASMGITLFPINAMPIEEQSRRLVSREYVGKMLEDVGCAQVPDTTTVTH